MLLKMTKNELILSSNILKIASDVFGSHRCNDVNEELYKNWTAGERKVFVKDYHDWNGDPEEYDENHLHLMDFSIMDFLAHKLQKQSDL